MNDKQTDEILIYLKRMTDGLIQIYQKLDELNGSIIAVSDCIGFKAAELDKRLQTTNRTIESVYDKEIILCDILADLRPDISSIKSAADETAGHTLTERNHAFRILQVFEQHTGIDHCDLIHKSNDEDESRICHH